MFKISIAEIHGQQRLVLEGTLVFPWTAEVERAWKDAVNHRNGRKPVIDLANVTCIGRQGEETLFKLMSQGARFRCADVFTKHVLKQLAKRIAARREQVSITTSLKRLSD